MTGEVFVALVLASIAASWICLVLGKQSGDELATWVIGHEVDDSLAPDFGIEWFGSNRKGRMSLRAYRYYSGRYRELRAGRGEDVRLARRFDILNMIRLLTAGLPFLFMVIALLLGEVPIR